MTIGYFIAALFFAYVIAVGLFVAWLAVTGTRNRRRYKRNREQARHDRRASLYDLDSVRNGRKW